MTKASDKTYKLSNFACHIGAVSISLSSFLSAFSIYQTWWSGEEAGRLVNFGGDTTLETNVGIWDFEIQVQTPQDTDGNTEKRTTQMSWNDACEQYELTKTWMADTCLKLELIRAMTISAWLLGMINVGLLIFAGLPKFQMQLMALPGAGIASLIVIMMLVALIFAASLNTSFDLGVSFLVAGVLFGILGACIALYATSKAVKEQEEAKPDVFDVQDRQTRVKEARQALEDDKNRLMGQKRPRTPASGSQAGSSEADSEEPKKQCVYLKKVLFWSREKEAGEDDEIPTEMLERAFWEIDEDQSGCIELEELVEALHVCGLEASHKAMDDVMREIDKNASGDIDLPEFVEFFRHIEELNRFQKKAAAKAQFAAFLLNCCFLSDIVIVGLLLMSYIRMDADTSVDDQVILKNALIGSGVLLLVLFVCVVAMPAARMTLGPSVEAWRAQTKQFQWRRPKPPAKQDEGPRQVAYEPEVAPIAPELTATSWRSAGRAQQMVDYAQQNELVLQERAEKQRRGSRKSSKRAPTNDSGSTSLSRTTGATQMFALTNNEKPDVVMSEQGEMLRYKPEAYQRVEQQMTSQMVSTGNFSRTMMSFSPLQVSPDIQTTIREVDQNPLAVRSGRLALQNTS